MTTMKTIRAAFDDAFTKAAGYKNVDPVELGIRAVALALRDEICNRVSPDCWVLFNDILGEAGSEKAAGGPTSNAGLVVEQSVATSDHSSTTPAADPPEQTAEQRMREAIERNAKMLETWAVECFPEVNELGQVHFGRALMESAAEDLREALVKP